MLKTSFDRSIVRRWVGSKFDFLSLIYELLPNDVENIVELFCGSAVFSLNLDLYKTDFTQDHNVIINDINPNLINFYNCLKFDPKRLLEILLDYEDLHSESFYYSVREGYHSNWKATYLSKDFIKAAEFLYLHYTCFNGLYRVNSDGVFNTPIGADSKGNLLKFKVSVDEIIETSYKLQNITIVNKNYREFFDKDTFAEQSIIEKNLLFIDPPYFGTHDKYSKEGFTLKDHIFLCEQLRELNKKGAYFILFNSDNLLYQTYLQEFNTRYLTRKGTVNSKGSARQRVKEVLYTNISVGD